MDKSVIEEASAELLELFDQVSDEARKEKNAVPPTNEMLYWWTRKPLIVGRTIALMSTLNDVTAVKDFLGLKREKRAYTYTPDAEKYKHNLGRDPSKIKLLDPFGGAGNLIFEAKRLGLDCTISDYNPVAFLLEKAVLEYPSLYGITLVKDFEKYGKLVIDKTKEEISKFYHDEDLVYLWVWCIKCPHCTQRVPLTNQMWIANNNKKIGVKFTITSDKNFKTELLYGMKTEEGKKFTQKGGKAICINCRNGIDYESMTKDIAKRKDREIIAKQIKVGLNDRKYVLVKNKDKEVFERATEYLKSKWIEFEDDNLIPDENILPNFRRENSLWYYGIKYWRDFFSHRQLLAAITIMKNIKIVCKEISDQNYRKILMVYLGFLLCKHINSNSLGVLWNPVGEKTQHVLSVRQPRLIYNHAEVNPFQKVAGSLPNYLRNIADAINFSSNNSNTPKISLESVLKLASKKEQYDLIITDPPYLDDVPYGELSEFFYVWISRILKMEFPELPDRVKLDEDICESWGRFGNKNLSNDFFIIGLKKSFISMNKILKNDGLLVVFFAHSTVEAWNLLLECIRESKFYVVSSYAIHTENVSNVIARGKTSFMSSIVVVCRKLNQESIAYFEDIIPLVEDKIKDMLNKISMQKLLSIQITDLLIMVYGKVLEAATNHTELRSYKKDFKPEFESLIANSRDFILREIVTKLTGRSINLLGPQMSFYLLTKIFYRGVLPGDDLLKVTRTYGVSKGQLEKDNIVKNENDQIRLYYLHEHKIEKKPEEIDNKNIYQQLCYLAQLVDTMGATKLTTVLSYSNLRVDDLKQVVSLLLKSFRLRVNKKEQLISEEQKELKILETLADIMGIKSENSLESFM